MNRMIDRPFNRTGIVRKLIWLYACKKCGGTIAPEYDGQRTCVNCGQEHDGNGDLVIPRIATEKPQQEGRLYQIGRKDEKA